MGHLQYESHKHPPKATVQQSLLVSPSTGSMFTTGVSFCLESHTLTVPGNKTTQAIITWHYQMKTNKTCFIINELSKFVLFSKVICKVSLVTISAASDDLRGPVTDAQSSHSIDAVYDLLVRFYRVHRALRHLQIPAKQSFHLRSHITASRHGLKYGRKPQNNQTL